jgi:hypothetical protein
MKLMPDAIAKKVPALYATEQLPLAQKVVQVKLFVPWSNWTWFICEYDPTERLAWGLVSGFEEEWGYFSLDEIEALRGPGGLTVERDLNFEPANAAVVAKRERLSMSLE